MADKIGGYTEQHLLKTACEVVAKKIKGSVILDVEAEERIPKFALQELEIGRVLGRGGFCAVSEITKITLNKEFDDVGIANSSTNGNANNQNYLDEHHIHNIVQDRNFMAQHCLRKKSHKKNFKADNGTDNNNTSNCNCRYAIKQLQDSNRKDPHIFINGIVDLVVEAKFLSVVRHPNIIKMRAMAYNHNKDGLNASVAESATTETENNINNSSVSSISTSLLTSSPTSVSTGFFVVLDRLYDILTTRLVDWKKQDIKGIKKVFDLKGKKKNAKFVERLTVAYDLSCALKYLHDSNILYRDLKPDNIGFDVRGDVKIFDFGLAKEIHPSEQDANGTFKLTGDTGSPRYMAPEVYLELPYNDRCDVYSFAILVWQILTLDTPFKGFTMSMFKKRIFVETGGVRPTCNEKAWPKSLVDLLRSCYGIQAKRPSMAEVSYTLRETINKLTESEDDFLTDGNLDSSRKSELSMKNGK